MKRKATIERITKETKIKLDLELTSLKESKITSGVPFFDHMLNLMAKHGRFSLNLKCQGDHEIDDHHSLEDIGISLGQALKKALGNKKGIARFGEAFVPMDESLSLAVIDLSGRSFFKYKGTELKGSINNYSEELTLEFLNSFAVNAEISLHVNLMYGNNRHHIHEAIFKSIALALYQAISIDKFLGDNILSTKGLL
jgi:imidazoleglycerol-phosphate dehydratase